MFMSEKESYSTVEINSDCYEFMSVKIYGNEDVLLTSMYRSSKSDNVNNRNLLHLMQEISDYNVRHKIVVRDFNLHNINWNKYTTEVGEDQLSYNFIEKKRDCFVLHIRELTRFQGSESGSVLDLVFTNDDCGRGHRNNKPFREE